ncbi:UNVERIFIED_CONTAM: hypothetical protein FKN15_053435 [Acipenser sinensis]
MRRGIAYAVALGRVALPLSQPVNCSVVRLQDGTFRYEVEECLQAHAADSSCHAEWSSQDKPIAIFPATDHSTLPPAVGVSVSFLLSEECVPDLLYKLECPSSGNNIAMLVSVCLCLSRGLNSSDTEEMDQPVLSWKFWVSVALSPLLLFVLLLAGVCVARVLCPERVPLVQAAVERMKGLWTAVATEGPGGGGEVGGEAGRRDSELQNFLIGINPGNAF